MARKKNQAAKKTSEEDTNVTEQLAGELEEELVEETVDQPTGEEVKSETPQETYKTTSEEAKAVVPKPSVEKAAPKTEEAPVTEPPKVKAPVTEPQKEKAPVPERSKNEAPEAPKMVEPEAPKQEEPEAPTKKENPIVVEQAAVTTEEDESASGEFATFSVKYGTNFGDSVYLIGSAQPFGEWNIDQALQLTWSEGDIWSGKLPVSDLPESFEVKFVINRTSSRWENGENRQIQLEELKATNFKYAATWQ